MMPFDSSRSCWTFREEPRSPQPHPEYIDYALLSSMIDFVMERCWDRLGFEALEEACERPTLSLLNNYLISYYDYLLDGQICQRCQTYFSDSTNIKLVGVPRLSPTEPYKVFLIHRYSWEEILCFSANEEKFYYTGDEWRRERAARIQQAMANNQRCSLPKHAKVIPVATITPIRRGYHQPKLHQQAKQTEPLRDKVMKLYKEHQQRRLTRTFNIWCPEPVSEAGEDLYNISMNPAQTTTKAEGERQEKLAEEPREGDWTPETPLKPKRQIPRLLKKGHILPNRLIHEQKPVVSTRKKPSKLQPPKIYVHSSPSQTGGSKQADQQESSPSPSTSPHVRPRRHANTNSPKLKRKNRSSEKDDKLLKSQSQQTYKRCLPPIGVSRIPVPANGFPANLQREEPPPKLPDIPEETVLGWPNMPLPRLVKPLPDWEELSRNTHQSHLPQRTLDKPHYNFMKPASESMRKMSSRTYLENSMKEVVGEGKLDESYDEFLSSSSWDRSLSRTFTRSMENIALSRSTESLAQTNRTKLLGRRISRSCGDLQTRGLGVSMEIISRDVQKILWQKLHGNPNNPDSTNNE